MSTPVESLQVMSRPGDNTGLGTLVLNADSNGTVSYGTAQHKHASSVTATPNILHDKAIINVQVLAAAVDNYIFLPTEGTWQVESATYLSQVAGTGGAATVDVVVAGAGVAPSAGTTQLDAALDLTTVAAGVDRSTIITTPTDIGPGAALALNYTGTLTSVVGLLTIQVKRVR